MSSSRDNHPVLHRSLILALFIVSASGLVFEIALTRIFSLYFQYHFAFLAVSLAVLGLSLGAAIGHYVPRRDSRTLAAVLIVLALALPAAAMLLSWYPSAENILPRAIIALVPFILIGLFSALTFAQFSEDSGLLYGADLIGAAVGVLAVLGLLNLWSAFSVLLLLGALVGAAALIMLSAHRHHGASKRLQGFAGLVTILGAILFGVNLLTGMVDFHPERLSGAPRDKTMLMILENPAQDATITRTAWSPFSRVDVVETNDRSAKYIFTDGGAGSYMPRYDGTLDSLRSWSESIDFLPFTVGSTDETLIVGAGGGKDIALALLGDAQHITALEVNPAVIAVTREDAAYNGNILDLPQVDLIEGDARSFVERNDQQYDLIYLNLVYTQAAEPGSQVLVENYIFTWEAFATYYERLQPGGHVAVVTHNALEASRAALTALRAMDELGIPPAEALDHLAMWMLPAGDATLRTSVLLIGKDPLTEDILAAMNRSALAQGMQALYVPGEFEIAFKPLRDGMPLADFADEDADYDLSPSSDDSPYFFHLDFGLPRPIQSALVTSALLASGMVIFGFLMGTSTGKQDSLATWSGMVLYAALIGGGFMLIEIPLIQRFQLVLGYPILSLVVVLGTLLLAGGAGSLLSQRWEADHLPRRVMLAALWIAVLAVVYRLALAPLLDAALGQPLVVRLLTVVVLTALFGVPLGIPFPSLLRMVGTARQRVALLWAVNGTFSVLGSVLAAVISMTWGFSWALLLGALLYLLLAGLNAMLLRKSA